MPVISIRMSRRLCALAGRCLEKLNGRFVPMAATIWNMTTKVPWRNKNGEIIGTFGASRDISDLKNAEAKIEETHKQLLETSRQAGMAEIATNVLHNIGNVLNSVNVSASLVVDNVKKSKAANLAKVAAMLREHAARSGDVHHQRRQGQTIARLSGPALGTTAGRPKGGRSGTGFAREEHRAHQGCCGHAAKLRAGFRRQGNHQRPRPGGGQPCA